MNNTHALGRLDEELGAAELVLAPVDAGAGQDPLDALALVAAAPSRPGLARQDGVALQELGERPAVGETRAAHADVLLQAEVLHLVVGWRL